MRSWRCTLFHVDLVIIHITNQSYLPLCSLYLVLIKTSKDSEARERGRNLQAHLSPVVSIRITASLHHQFHPPPPLGGGGDNTHTHTTKFCRVKALSTIVGENFGFYSPQKAENAFKLSMVGETFAFYLPQKAENALMLIETTKNFALRAKGARWGGNRS